jgi:hypothetical protein
MPHRIHRLSFVRLLFTLVASAVLGVAGTGIASATPAATAQVSWRQAPNDTVLPPPNDPARGFCTPTRIGLRIRLDCVIKVDDTTLWVACSGGFVEIRHISAGTHQAEGTCPQYGGYALTATSS